MARCPYMSDSSDCSDYEDQAGIHPHCLPEKKVLNSKYKTGGGDDWPTFLLEDATVYLKDGVTIANLLNVEMEGLFIIRGRLVVEWGDDETKCLIKKNVRNQHVEIICSSFSIGQGPTTLWAEGNAGWFEIKPSADYQKMYTKIAQGVEIYFGIVQVYEDLKKSTKKGWQKALTVEEVLARYGMKDSTGLFYSEIVARVEEHAQFLLLHMLKSESIAFKATTIYKWLIEEFSDISTQIQQKALETVQDPVTTRATRILPPVWKPIATSSPESLINRSTRERFSKSQGSLESQRVLRKSQSSTPSSSSSKPSHAAPAAAANKIQLSSAEVDAVTGIVVRLMNEAVTSGRYEREKMRLASVWGMFYLDYSINDPKDCKMAVEVAAESIMSKLGDEWKETKVYKALDEVAREKKKNKSAKLKQIVQGEGFKERVKTIRCNSKSTGHSSGTRPNSSRRTLSTPSTSAASNSRSTSTKPRAAKTLPATQAAQPTGKAAALRLAQTTLKRTNGALSTQLIHNSGDDEEDDTTPDLDLVDDPYTNLRKRPRNPDWDTMGNQYIDGVTSEDSPFFVPNGEREYELRINNPGFEIVYESLPSMTSTGPLGSYKCTVDQSCSFICHEPETPCGKEEIQKHFQKHTEKLEQENIMFKEAALSRKSVSYLQEFMDKKRREGERERLAEEEKRQVINGRVVPKPIKRRYGV